MKKLNWDYIHYCIKDRTGYSLSKYSQVKLGRSESYLSQCKNGGFNLSKNALDYMIKDLGLDEKALWQTDEITQHNDDDDEFNCEMTAEEFEKAFTVDTSEKAHHAVNYLAQADENESDDEKAVEPLEPWKSPIFGDNNGIYLLEELNTKVEMILELETKINRLSDQQSVSDTMGF